MLLHRIKAEFFKTYFALDLDLSVQPDKPLIVIGGANGGGKTTLFQAIYGALYGLTITSDKEFWELYNSGTSSRESSSEQAIKHITLEIHFSGHLLGQDTSHILTRRYELSAQKHASKTKTSDVVEYVSANFGGSKYAYNSAMTLRERQKHQMEIAKIIRAHLPEELSHYFLFDAMESGALMREDEIQRVIRENIENVMGFRKYTQLGRVAETLAKRYRAEKLRKETEKQEYMRLLGEKHRLESRQETVQQEYKTALAMQQRNQNLYETLKNDLNAALTIAKNTEQIRKEIETITSKTRSYQSAVEGMLNQFDQCLLLPTLAQTLHTEITSILAATNNAPKQQESAFSQHLAEKIVSGTVEFLAQQGALLLAPEPTPDYWKNAALSHLLEEQHHSTEAIPPAQEFSFLNNQELRALENILSLRKTNNFSELVAQKQVRMQEHENIPTLQAQLEEWSGLTEQKDFSLIRLFERNEITIEQLHDEQKRIVAGLEEISQRLQTFDIDNDGENSSKGTITEKLKPFFVEVGETLLQAKRRQIEMTMMRDLNINLVPYRGVIDRVEILDAIGEMTFKIFHTSGNEIALNQLNTASKQIVVQCLLKALHEFGEYNPPVMIDTVMGALDEASRQTVIEHYFPELSHQTILLSSDSEIRPEGDFEKLLPFISRAYTLKRDKEHQATEILSGYFGKTL
ncbi:MAG: AAA family ATPase [Candidatus Kapabacteria bacterium]|jgi:DNA sulfur modification protein DndD|nr:AAA family ATPase [Candidatus Kapabacteria bacterium]